MNTFHLFEGTKGYSMTLRSRALSLYNVCWPYGTSHFPLRDHPDVIKKFSLPTAHDPVEMYLSRSKIHAEHTHGGNNQTIDMDALMLYAPKNQAELVIIYTSETRPKSTNHQERIFQSKYHNI
jgi:hypothetical protein